MIRALSTGVLLAVSCGAFTAFAADEIATNVGSVLEARCAKCHGKEETEGDVNLHVIKSHKELLAQPELIRRMIEAVDTFDMPPESEPEFADADRTQFLNALKQSLSLAIADDDVARVPIHRLNRFQYNNVIRDLFALDHDVFRLPERLMTRHSNYLAPVVTQMPDEVDVTCDALRPQGGMRDVEAFPKDLQAEHGYDNQADRLTLSPLLLDSMLDVCVSILNSPDFNSDTVGTWNDYFAEPPEDEDLRSAVEVRIKRLTRLAFRGPVDDRSVTRYLRYIQARLEQGTNFTQAMKDGTAAILSSPKFLFRIWEASPKEEHAQFALASRLSFCLWGSGPDDQLLKLAEAGKLTDELVLRNTVQRMLVDPKIERFLDSFPAQWMKLESILSAAPDPGKNRLYNIGKQPAGVQMVLEPLLLFDTVFLENRPLRELISPQWSWRNDFLHDWYTSDLRPPKIDEKQIAEDNEKLFTKRRELYPELSELTAELERLTADTEEQVRAERQPVKLDTEASRRHLLSVWEFNGDLTDSVGDVDLISYGHVNFKDGAVILGDGYLESPLLRTDLRERTLTIRVHIDDLNQRSAVAMALTNSSRSIFEAISLGMEHPAQRSVQANDPAFFPPATAGAPETSSDFVQFVFTRDKDGRTATYRNGQPYVVPNRLRNREFRANDTVVTIGRLLIAKKPDVTLNAAVDRASLYDRALSPEQVRALYQGRERYVSVDESLAAMKPEQQANAKMVFRTINEKRREFRDIPLPGNARRVKDQARKAYEARLAKKRNSRFRRVPIEDRRYGGIVTNAAVLTMTSAPTHTQPIARGVWLTQVIFNNPPPPPPNNIPTLDESVADKSLTVRERFARHRADPDCTACHARIDPLGFALENFDIVGRWRDTYQNNRPVDPSGRLLKSHQFKDVIEFKQALLKERSRFARAFTEHFVRFFATRELTARDALEIDRILAKTSAADYRIQEIIRTVCVSRQFFPDGVASTQAAKGNSGSGKESASNMVVPRTKTNKPD